MLPVAANQNHHELEKGWLTKDLNLIIAHTDPEIKKSRIGSKNKYFSSFINRKY